MGGDGTAEKFSPISIIILYMTKPCQWFGMCFDANVNIKVLSVTLILKSRSRVGMKLHKISTNRFHHIVYEQTPANKLEIKL